MTKTSAEIDPESTYEIPRQARDDSSFLMVWRPNPEPRHSEEERRGISNSNEGYPFNKW